MSESPVAPPVEDVALPDAETTEHVDIEVATQEFDGMIPENPLVEGDTEYSVRLVFRVNAESPEHARTRFIATIAEFGLNTWTYRVTDIETDEDFFVQAGLVMTPEEFAARVDDDDDDAQS